jgi:hypothetical protein
MEFKEFLENKEEEEMTKALEEDAAGVVGSILGYGAAGLAAAFGGTLLALGGIKAIKGLKGLWQRIFKTGKQVFNPSAVASSVRTDPKVKKVKEEVAEKRKQYESELKYVYIAIANKDWDQAKEEYGKLEASLQNNPDVHKSIIAEIVRVLKTPPIYIQSPGNTSYQAIKKVINIKVARAAAAATDMALRNMQ